MTVPRKEQSSGVHIAQNMKYRKAAPEPLIVFMEA